MNNSSNSHLEADKVHWSIGDVVIALLLSGLSFFCVVGVMRYVQSIPDLMKENYELFVSLAVGVLYLISKYPIDRASYGFQRKGFKRTIVWGLMGGVILSAINSPYKTFVKGVTWEKFEKFIALNPGDFSICVFLAFAIIILPVLEEIFFRGCVYRILKGSLNPFWSVLITSSVSALGHYDAASFIYSLFLIGILEWSGYLGASIVAHVMWNATWYLSLLIFKF